MSNCDTAWAHTCDFYLAVVSKSVADVWAVPSSSFFKSSLFLQGSHTWAGVPLPGAGSLWDNLRRSLSTACPCPWSTLLWGWEGDHVSQEIQALN